MACWWQKLAFPLKRAFGSAAARVKSSKQGPEHVGINQEVATKSSATRKTQLVQFQTENMKNSIHENQSSRRRTDEAPQGRADLWIRRREGDVGAAEEAQDGVRDVVPEETQASIPESTFYLLLAPPPSRVYKVGPGLERRKVCCGSSTGSSLFFLTPASEVDVKGLQVINLLCIGQECRLRSRCCLHL